MNADMQDRINGWSSIPARVRIQNGGTANSESSPGIEPVGELDRGFLGDRVVDTGCRRPGWVLVRARFGCVERGDHLHDHLASLDRGDSAGVKRAAVAGPLDLEADVLAVTSAAHEVQME
jgi:hypothetical protein